MKLMHLISLCSLSLLTLTATPMAHASQPTKAQQYQIYHEFYTKQPTEPASIANRLMPWEADATLPKQYPNGVIPYYINTTNASQRQAWQTAIDAWNQLGVVHLVAQSSPQTAGLILTDYPSLNQFPNLTVGHDEESKADGITWYNMNTPVVAALSASLNSASTIKLGKYWTSAEQYHALVAEHELGHALGFAHDNYQAKAKSVRQFYQYNPTTNTVVPSGVIGKSRGKFELVMNAGTHDIDVNFNNVFALGQAEANTLRAHYQINN